MLSSASVFSFMVILVTMVVWFALNKKIVTKLLGDDQKSASKRGQALDFYADLEQNA